MDQEATDSESFEICECGDEERSLAGPRCFEVLRTLVKGGEVAWVCVNGLRRLSPRRVAVQRTPEWGVPASFAAAEAS